MNRIPWTDDENDSIVADYFKMLELEQAGEAFNKAEHNRFVQSTTGRSRGSIEWKYQNISAILIGLGEVRIEGYKPAFNFQMPLVDAVAKWLAVNPAWEKRVSNSAQQHMSEPASLWVGPPPTLKNSPPPDEAEQMSFIARKFDVAGRDERNRTLGRAGEKLVLAHERAQLALAGRQDLAEQVVWISEDEGDGVGYDIASFNKDGSDRLIEVKTTNGWERTPFHISRNELIAAEAMRDRWSLIRVWDFSRAPNAFEIHPPLDAHVELMPTSYQASFH